MRLEVERTGGFAGRTVRWALDVDDLDPDVQAEVHQLLTEAPGWPASSGADRFSYRLTTTSAGADALDMRFGEPLPEPARRLLSVVRSATT